MVSVESKAGYKALHLYYLIKSDPDSADEIGCEFQVLTVFQDAWARVSHELTYKIDGSRRSKRNVSMTKLAKLRDDADSLIDKATKD